MNKSFIGFLFSLLMMAMNAAGQSREEDSAPPANSEEKREEDTDYSTHDFLNFYNQTEETKPATEKTESTTDFLHFFSTGDNNTATLSEVKIGDQTWATRNLDVTTFRNGDRIPEAKSNQEWLDAIDGTTPAWCYLKNGPANGTKYGKLYNLYAVTDPRGLAPAGWHVPKTDEWAGLLKFLQYDIVDRMRKREDWGAACLSGTNESGFTALPGGARDSAANFIDYTGNTGYWWTSSPGEKRFAGSQWTKFMALKMKDTDREIKLDKYVSYGFSVRCIKD